MDRIRLNEETGIPLFLIPEKIKGKIKKMGDRIYRISVKRTEHHHYSVSVRTKTLPRELMPVQLSHPLSVPPVVCRKVARTKGGVPS
jgi:hypothetical protein